MQQSSPAPPQTAASNAGPQPSASEPIFEAPPKQVALAMDRLSQAGRLIADIRIGADRLLEALFVSASEQHQQSNKPLQLILKEEASMRQHLQDLLAIGKQLEDSGVLNDSLRSRSNSWGLHMPLVCPDGAVVAYAWKRQLAGQAGASAVDRTRLALKAFTDQKRRFFPHLDDDDGAEPAKKKFCVPQPSEELSDQRTLSDVLMLLEKEVPNVKTSTYQRLEWLKRASMLPSCESSIESPKDHGFHSDLGLPSVSNVTADKASVIELLCPSIFRVIISLHPAGSTDPDAVAFFSPHEGGSYMHARGVSTHHVFKHITEHASLALQYFVGSNAETALYTLLNWVCSYQTILSKACR
ncbi:OLC1v1013151C4 [Oldenlandia corymbosa var. corymbosa]|uniref:OLC1v1013151C4 n=1 Tax=Oldenlandia corymbosa var. corymbosa TaxID=529605 RepID=A0AAV1E0T7_OLDCO|nr:OLC1v1013151C4 [Oldenlandia corymbosa var. corymbosa]